MLVVKLEIWPFGEKAARRELGRITIANVGGPDEACKYDVQATGEAARDLHLEAIRGLLHARADGAWKLVSRALSALSGVPR